MAAMVRISVVILIFLVLNSIFLSGKYHGSSRISKYFVYLEAVLFLSYYHQNNIWNNIDESLKPLGLRSFKTLLKLNLLHLY